MQRLNRIINVFSIHIIHLIPRHKLAAVDKAVVEPAAADMAAAWADPDKVGHKAVVEPDRVVAVAAAVAWAAVVDRKAAADTVAAQVVQAA